jgi:hypothetical protein
MLDSRWITVRINVFCNERYRIKVELDRRCVAETRHLCHKCIADLTGIAQRLPNIRGRHVLYNSLCYCAVLSQFRSL